MPIRLKRAYDPPEAGDGFRVLVDRLWPRGIRKESLLLDAWYKDVAPCDSLRKWFGHDPIKWNEFKTRYFQELDENPEGLSDLLEKAVKGRLTIIYASREETFNNAVALKEYLEGRNTVQNIICGCLGERSRFD